MIFLDTNAVIAVLELRPERVGERLVARQDEGETIVMSSIVLFEMWFGIAKSRRQEVNAARLETFLQRSVEVVNFDAEDARLSGFIRHELAARGTPIGPYDLLIAAQALRHGATLVTANTREFTRVPGLQVEDWAAQ